MNNFELIDDYLTERLSEAEKAEFEKQLASDPALKAELDLQKQILEGIRKNRAAELKSMLKNVPISTGTVIQFSVARMAAGLIVAGAVSAAIYFYVKPGDVPDMKGASADLSKKSEQLQAKGSQVAKEEEAKQDITTVEQSEEKSLEKQKPSADFKAKTESTKPKLDVADPTEEMTEAKNEPGVTETSKGSVSTSHIDVSTDPANKNYNFHYQFASGKLYLYGPFDKSLYEILEINSDNKAVFLFYKDNYYLLDGKQLTVTRLEPITDPALIKKLKEYRNK